MDDFARYLAALGDGVARLAAETSPSSNVAAAAKDIQFAHDGLARIYSDQVIAQHDDDQLEFDF